MPQAGGGAQITGSGQIATGAVTSDDILDDEIVNADIDSAAAIALSKLATDPLARANHTGTQAKATISDYPAAASQAEMEAGTETAAREMTPQRVKQAIDALAGGSCLTLIPRPVAPLNPAAAAAGIARDLSTNTLMHVALIYIPRAITINKVSIRTGTVSGAGGDTIDIGLYSESGGAYTALVANGAIAGGDDNVVKTFTITQTTIAAGFYWLAMNNNNASGTQFLMWDTDAAAPFSSTDGLLEDVASEPILQGTVTITAGTPPATITPTAISPVDDSCIIVRFDN